LTTFLLHPKPLQGESLTSFIYRVATYNIVSPFDIWKLMLYKNFKKPMSSMSPKLNLYPHTVFNLRKFESFLTLKGNELDSLTFLPVFKKFGVNADKMPSSNFLYSLIDKYLNFCPQCLEEDVAHKLVWQIKEIPSCNIHKIKLASSCHSCKSNIPMLAADSSIDHCPYCNFELAKSPRIHVDINEVDSRALLDWYCLLKGDILEQESIQSIAIKLLYLSKNYNIKMKSYDISSNYSILRLIKDDKTYQTALTLGPILKMLRAYDVTMDSFLRMSLPEGFIASTLEIKDVSSFKNFTCLAPWCEGYKKTGTLKSFTTLRKKTQKGVIHNSYYCNKCGINYSFQAINNLENPRLIENGYFVDFAWDTVRNSLGIKSSVNSLSKYLNSSKDKLIRSILYLSANKLVANEKLPIKLRMDYSSYIETKILDGLLSGESYDNIRKKLGLSYYESLYYLFLPNIYVKYQERKVLSPCKVNKGKESKDNFDAAIDHFINNKINITVKGVCDYLGVSYKALKIRGLMPYLHDAKRKQQLNN
jgi:hypothetical protein